jgi:hypothetical protein
MFPFYAVMIKKPWLIFGILVIVFTTLFSIAIPNHDLSLAEHIGKSMFMGIVMTGFMKVSLSGQMRLDVSLLGPMLKQDEKIVRSAQAGHMVDGQPTQGNLILTNQRLIFCHSGGKQWLRPSQVEADRNEISEAQLSILHSKYRTGVTVKVKDREHIFTVSLADRWVDDIRNVVRHGHTAN